MKPLTRDNPLAFSRRAFLARSAGATAAVFAGSWAHGAATGGVFTLGQRGGRWWLLTPAGAPFFSLGFNHIDSAPLRSGADAKLWQEKYNNSTERWLRESVAPDLRAWGFNTVGWTSEVVVRGEKMQRHSPPFTLEEYQWLGLPYCHLLPFAEIHQWEQETRLPNFFSADFADWCDYVARMHCARMAGDPQLIGYFYSDCPVWLHTRPANAWKGALFDPAKLESAAGRRELFELATRYYRVTHDAIRRYDSRHLILGDRYEARAPLAAEIFEAAKPFVDVLCFQHFGPPAMVAADLQHWHEQTGMPVLLADHADVRKAADGAQRHDGAGYAETLRLLRAAPGCVGFHLCGAYLRNEARKRALRDAREQPDAEAIAAITAANSEAATWMAAAQ